MNRIIKYGVNKSELPFHVRSRWHTVFCVKTAGTTYQHVGCLSFILYCINSMQQLTGNGPVFINALLLCPVRNCLEDITLFSHLKAKAMVWLTPDW